MPFEVSSVSNRKNLSSVVGPLYRLELSRKCPVHPREAWRQDREGDGMDTMLILVEYSIELVGVVIAAASVVTGMRARGFPRRQNINMRIAWPPAVHKVRWRRASRTPIASRAVMVVRRVSDPCGMVIAVSWNRSFDEEQW